MNQNIYIPYCKMINLEYKFLFSLHRSFWLAVCTQHEKWSGRSLAILVRNSTSLAWAAELFWCKKPQPITWLIYQIKLQMYYVIHGKNSNICFIMCHNSTWLYEPKSFQFLSSMLMKTEKTHPLNTECRKFAPTHRYYSSLVAFQTFVSKCYQLTINGPCI